MNGFIGGLGASNAIYIIATKFSSDHLDYRDSNPCPAGLPSTDSQIPSGLNIASGKQNFLPITFVVVIQDIGTKIKNDDYHSLNHLMIRFVRSI